MNAQTIKGAILGLATADALGVPVEFESRARLKENPVTGMRSGGSWGQEAGTWSDDTTMTIATMESIARLGGIDYADIMNNFLHWYEHDDFTATGELFDIGNTTRAALVRYSRKILPPTKCGATDENSNGNGSLMRILPAALYMVARRGRIGSDELAVIHRFSALTHAHAVSKISCGIYSLVAAQILNGRTVRDAFTLAIEDAKKFYGNDDAFSHFARLCNEDFAALPEDEISSGGYVLHTLEAALWCLLNTNDYKSLALKAVNLGKDTDTTGAVAGGLAGLVYGAESIPADWLAVLKRRDYLESLCEDFAAIL